MLTLEELHQILKSRSFKSKVEGSDDSFIFTFTGYFIFRNNDLLCEYELIQDNGNFKFVFQKLPQNISTNTFKNVIFVIPDDNRFPIIVNSDSLAVQAGKGFDITLMGQ